MDPPFLIGRSHSFDPARGFIPNVHTEAAFFVNILPQLFYPDPQSQMERIFHLIELAYVQSEGFEDLFGSN